MKMAKGEELIVVSIEDDFGNPLNLYVPVVVEYEAITYVDGADADGKRVTRKTEYFINDYRLDHTYLKKHPEITLAHITYALELAGQKFLTQIHDGTVGKCNLMHFVKDA